MIRTAITLLVVTAGIGCDQNNDIGPGSLPPPGHCSVADYHAAPDPSFHPATSPARCPVPTETVCSCADYSSGLPEGAFNYTKTDTCTVAGGCAAGRTKGCYDNLDYAWPDCAMMAEASGIVGVAHNFSTPDSDWTFDMCPDLMTVDPFTGGSQELRVVGDKVDSGNFINPDGRSAIGRLEIEVQDCRLFDGNYTIPETGASVSSRPQPGDSVSAAGDWVVDTGHEGWTELHEARIMSTVRPVNDTLSYLFVSGFFAQQSGQEKVLKLDVKVPKTKTITGNLKLSCDVPSDPTPGCAPKPGVQVRAIGDAKPGLPYGICTIKIERGTDTAALPFGCHPADECQEQPYHSLPACQDIFFAGAIKATWSDPADLWTCTCDCDDPAQPGAVIAAPIQGCAQAGLDPANAADQRTACLQICGGQFCGAAPACDVGVCHPPASGGAAQLIGRNVCDPAQQSQQNVRVAAVGDYRATFDASASHVTLTVSGHATTTAVRGDVHLNIGPGTPGVIDFADLIATPIDFSVAGHDVSQAAVFTAERLFGQLTSATAFEIPPGVGVLAVRGIVDGKPRGINVINPQAATGTLDLSTTPARFLLDVAATDPEASDRLLTAHIEGTIDDRPPVADIGRTRSKVECTSPGLTSVTLDGSASSDPDPGDQIAHYQWFSPSAGIGNQAVVQTQLPLDTPTPFDLHVYDRELGSSTARVTVTVADTTPPTLTVSPTSMCLWPPDHHMACFKLGDQIKAVAADTCDPDPIVQIASVSSSEPVDGIGDGHTSGDITFDSSQVCVRRERSGTGPGRVYTVVIRASDHSGNAIVHPFAIRVPHDEC